MSKILTIDIGNTRAKYAIFDDAAIIESGVFNPYNNDLKEVIGRHHEMKSGILSSVGGKVEECLEQLKEMEIITLSGTSPLPFEIPYANKEQIGSDRIAAVAGAMSIKPNENNLIIDIGTCITYDIVTSENIYHCGPISPGINLRFKSMNDYTNKLPLCTATNDDLKVICESTEECLQSGVLMAIGLEIEGFIKIYSNKFKDLNVFIIGGDNIFFENKLKNCIFADANFIFKGLRYILNYQ